MMEAAEYRKDAPGAHHTGGIPWYVWCAAMATTSAMVGAHWDISWHSSIGRDTFWTPAHTAIYLCGVLAGVAFGYLILATSFQPSSPLRDSSVHIWGFRAPLGAFIASWGGIAMLTSAPFDNWWHDAYGLDVKIVSPPHILLFLGAYGVIVGTLVLIAGYANRVAGVRRTQAWTLFIYVAGVGLTMAMILIEEFTSRVLLHSARPYVAISILTPLILASVSWASARRWAATSVAAIFTAIGMLLIWILPLFPAEPKLGPVYQHVTHFIPPAFPVLLIVPALMLDVLWPAMRRRWNPWMISLVSAVIFLATLIAVEWPFASFLMSPGARNWFFGASYFWYGLPPTSYLARNLFYGVETPAAFLTGIFTAVVVATLSFRFGISRGTWLREVKR